MEGFFVYLLLYSGIMSVAFDLTRLFCSRNYVLGDYVSCVNVLLAGIERFLADSIRKRRKLQMRSLQATHPAFSTP